METQENEALKSYPAKTPSPKALISIPHSGDEVPNDFKPYLTKEQRHLDCDLDYKIDEALEFDRLQAAGAELYQAKIHRVCVDLNRRSEQAVLNWKSNSKGQKLVIEEASKDEQDKFLASYYFPYMKLLKNRVTPEMKFLDIHSMPSKATAYHLKKNPHQKTFRPDFCLSDLNGKSAPREDIEFLQKAFNAFGYRALINDPYKGGEITRFMSGYVKSAIQIETSRALYMDEDQQRLIPEKIKQLKEMLTQVLCDYLSSRC